MSTPVFFFAATPFDVATMSIPQDLQGKLLVQSKNIAPNMIGDLDFLLTGVRTREPECVRSDENIAVFQLDEELVEALAATDEDAVDELADEWGIFDAVSTTHVLNELRAVAQ